MTTFYSMVALSSNHIYTGLSQSHRFVFCFLTFIFFFLGTSNIKAQNDLIQFSGYITISDSSIGIPYAYLENKQTKHIALSDHRGFFSFVVHPNDTIEIHSIGFKYSSVVIPPINRHKYNRVITLKEDTVLIEEINIYPWPSPKSFKKAFLALKLPSDPLESINEYIRPEKMLELANQLDFSGYENSRYILNESAKNLYYRGQSRPIALLDIFAWMQFIQNIKNGVYKRKRK